MEFFLDRAKCRNGGPPEVTMGQRGVWEELSVRRSRPASRAPASSSPQPTITHRAPPRDDPPPPGCDHDNCYKAGDPKDFAEGTLEHARAVCGTVNRATKEPFYKNSYVNIEQCAAEVSRLASGRGSSDFEGAFGATGVQRKQQATSGVQSRSGSSTQPGSSRSSPSSSSTANSQSASKGTGPGQNTGGSCNPIDAEGKSCISYEGQSVEHLSQGKIYRVKFRNSATCGRTIVIRATATNGRDHAGGVYPGKSMTLSCVEWTDDACSGFVSWKIYCGR